MGKIPKVARLLAQTVPLVLEVDEGAHKLVLNIAWNMRAAIMIEQRLRQMGITVNVLQDLKGFWADLDATRLVVGLWATAQQDSPEYADEEGFEVISSFVTPDNYPAAVNALQQAFLESLSPARREAIKQEAAKAASAGAGAAPTPDPTPAPG